MSGHYLTTIDPNCSCDYTPVRDPAEPQLGSWLEAEQDDLCPVHSRLPAWVPDWLDATIRFWRRAARDPERGELTARQWGDPPRYVTHGWWLNPTVWALGLDFDYETFSGETRRTFGLAVGPLSWSINYHRAA